MKRVFLCLPKEDESQYHVLAQHHILEAIQHNAAPFAPSLYAAVLAGELERREGLLCSLAFLQVCDEVWVFGHPSLSMQTELSMALELGIPVRELPLSLPATKTTRSKETDMKKSPGKRNPHRRERWLVFAAILMIV